MVLQQLNKVTPERKQLKITSVGDIIRVGDKQIEKLPFKARDGKYEYDYFTFTSKLFPVIQDGLNKNIEFDVETSQNGQYINRKVTQAYVNSEPVLVKKTGNGHGGHSPEDRASIEAQVAAKLAVELRIADKIADDSPEYQQALAWIKSRMLAVLIN